MVTSAMPEEGKSTTASNLAVAYAQEGKRVLLIDGDLRKPSLHHIFQQSNRIGLTNVLLNQYVLADVIEDTTILNLSVMTSGSLPPNPSEILGSAKMHQVMEELKGAFDIIVFDTPPVLAVTDALIISSLCDGVILTVHAGKVKKDLIRKAKSRLEHVKARIVGAVLNNKVFTSHERKDYCYGIEQ